MKVLLVEDNQHKTTQITDYINSYFPLAKVSLRKSYNSGLRELIKKQDYDIILLDMSLPNYDIEGGESGDDFEPLAGKYLLSEMYRREINVKVSIITMYESYVDEEFNADLKLNFPNYEGVIYFNLNDPDGWKAELFNLFTKIQQ